MTVATPFLGVGESFSGRAWWLRPGDERQALAIAQALGVPEPVARLLAARGVTIETAEQYLQPSLRSLLPDPSTLRDMDAAAERLAAAVESGEQIVVFGDYDVDGATSSALLQRYFRTIGHPIGLYVPDRLAEGYGPNAPALRRLAAQGARVVVTVDCGTLAHGPLAEARVAGLDVIVVDHHLAEPELPPALVVNPNRLDESNGVTMLAAVGVTYLLVVAINRALRRVGWFQSRPEPDLLQWLDLAALGTVCDLVPMQGLNRALVAQGLKVMRRRANAGLVALVDVAQVEERLDTFHAGFVFGPRVNAGGRVGRSDLGARLLATDDPVEAGELAAELDRFNAERRAIEAIVIEQAMAEAAATDAGGEALILLAARGWHPGVVGIVATRVKDHFNRPTIVIGIVDGIGKGSGRSLSGFDLGAAVIAARQAGLLINGGGHAAAAGLTVAEEKIAALREFLRARALASLGAEPPRRGLNVDGILTLGGATTELVEQVARAGPFGTGNPEPRFVFAGVRAVVSEPAGTDHVRCVFVDDSGARLRGIAFRVRERPLGASLLAIRGRPVHVAGYLRADTYRGGDRVTLQIEDAAPARS
jgi:single-stranded-DNA-specific exonuclease